MVTEPSKVSVLKWFGGMRAAMTELTTWAVFALLCALWITVEWNIVQDRRHSIEQVQLLTSNLARAFEYHVARVIEEIDNSLVALRWRAVNSEGEAFDLSKIANQPGYMSRYIKQYVAIDADGFARNTLQQGHLTTPIDVRDRSHFKAHLSAHTDQLFLSEPLIGRSTKAWTVNVSRRIVDKEGNFRGVLVASLDPFALSSVYASFDLGKTGTITLVGLDGVVRARAPDVAKMLGQKINSPEILAALGQTTAGLLELEEFGDEPARYVAVRIVPGLPLAVLVSKDKSEVFSGDNFSAVIDRIAAMLVTVMVVALCVAANRFRSKLSAKNYRLEGTLRHMNQGIMIVEADGSLSLINQRAIDLLELPQEFMTNTPSYRGIFSYQLDRGEFGPKTEFVDKALLEAVWKNALSQQESLSERVRPNGTVLQIFTARLPQGGFIRTFTDITQHRRDATTIQKAMGDLERFAHLASHDLQLPLRKIATHAALLRQSLVEGDDIERERCLNVINASAQRGRNMVADLLRYSKLKDGELRREPVRIDKIVNRFVDDLLVSGAYTEAKIKSTLPALTVKCSASLIYQVFQNLLENATKYRVKDSIADIRIFGEETAEGYIIHVADRGIGFDTAMKETIFQPFKRLTAQKTTEGTGIGLSLVLSIVLKHGWTIDAQSEIGRGSDFFITIPNRDIVRENEAIAQSVA